MFQVRGAHLPLDTTQDTGFVNSPVQLQAAMICFKKKVLIPTRFFSLKKDRNI